MIYGDIKSCKIELDEAGTSQGYGYVTYYRPEDAMKCISNLNGQEIEGEKIEIMDIVTPSSDSKNVIYMKHLPLNFEQNNLKELLSTYGEISNVKMCCKDGKFTGAAIISFSDFRSATAAVKDLNYKGTVFPGQLPLYVNFLQKKEERTINLGMKSLKDQRNKIQMSRSEPVALFAKLIESNYFKDQEEFEKSIRLFMKVVMLSEFSPLSITCNYSRTSAVVTVRNMKDAFEFMEKYRRMPKPEFYFELIQTNPQPIIPYIEVKVPETNVQPVIEPIIKQIPNKQVIAQNNQIVNPQNMQNDPFLNRFEKININEQIVPINHNQMNQINQKGPIDRNMYPQSQMISQQNNFQSDRMINNNQQIPHSMNQHFYNGIPQINQNYNKGNMNINQINNINQMNKMGNIIVPNNQDFRNPHMQNFNPLINNPHTFPIHQPSHMQTHIPIIIPQNQPTFNKFNPNFHDPFQVPINQPFNPLGINLNRDIQEIPHITKNILVNPVFNPQQQIHNHNQHNINRHQINNDMYSNNIFSSPYLIEREKLLFSQNDRLSNIEGKVEMNFKEERLKEMNGEELSNEIYDVVVTIYPNDAAKITGMLSDLGDDQMRRLLLNPLEMKDLMDQAYKVSHYYLLF